MSEERGIENVFELLNENIKKVQKEQNFEDYSLIAKNIHILPDFHGKLNKK